MRVTAILLKRQIAKRSEPIMMKLKLKNIKIVSTNVDSILICPHKNEEEK